MTMGNKALRHYVRLAISEMRGNARVPTQLLEPEEETAKEKTKDDEEVDEMSSCGGGAVAGFTAPLGSGKRRK
jgi:hypothetical protein